MFVFYDFQVQENHKLPRNFYISLQLLCNYIAGPKDVRISVEGSTSIFLHYMSYLPAKAATKLHCSSEANYFIRILNTISGLKFIYLLFHVYKLPLASCHVVLLMHVLGWVTRQCICILESLDNYCHSCRMISSGDDTTDLVSYDSDVNKMRFDVYEFHRSGAIIALGDIMNGVWQDMQLQSNKIKANTAFFMDLLFIR